MNSGEQLLDDIEAYLGRFVIYPSRAARVAHVLWIAHTWLMEYWDSTPRIAFLSPEWGSGKSRALEVTEPLVPRPVHAVSASQAYLFRKVSDEAGPPTILYDEIDTVFGPKAKDNEDIRGMLNAGHRKGATAGRCVKNTKGEIATDEFPAYCAVALAGLRDLPDTIMSRSVVVRMRRRAHDETVEPWRRRIHIPQAAHLKDRIAAWIESVKPEMEKGNFWPDMPKGIEDRDGDIWEALLVVADLAGGRWPELARVTAVTHVTASRQKEPSIGIQLLADIKTAFDTLNRAKLRTEELLTFLNTLEESPWATISNGSPLNARGLAVRLGAYEIGSKSLRDGGDVFKGYSRDQFEDAWKRYLPAESVTSVTPVTPQVNGAEPVTGQADVTDERLHNVDLFDALTSDVTDVTAVTATGGKHCTRCDETLDAKTSIDSGLCAECRLTDENELCGV